MSQIKLTTPEGYFENSFERTMRAASEIDRRRKVMAGGFAAIALLLGISYSAVQSRQSALEKEYYAMEMELSQLDVFMEINQTL